MGTITLIAICISALATGVIAWYAIANHKLTSKIQSRDDEFRQQISDLYKAIVISNLMGSFKLDDLSDGRERLREAIELFAREYQKIGKTPIFVLRGHKYTQGKVI